MTTVMTAMKRWQDKYLETMTRVEEPVVRYTERAIETIADYVPERPQWAFLKEVPTMTEVVDSQLKFRRRIVDEQAAFVRKMMKAMRPTRHMPEAPAAKRVVSKASPVRRVRPSAA